MMTAEVIKRCGEAGKRAVQENLYDGDGLRCGLVEDGLRTDFVTNGWENLAELDEAGEVKKRILRGVGIVASEEDHAYHYYHGNERMDVELITDEQGGTCNRYRYDAFGGITESEEEIGNRYTYNGEAYDRLTGQYYLRKRFYNPAVCRFTQEDEYRGDGLNLYAFCANNPVMYVDPSGYAANTSVTNFEKCDIGKKKPTGEPIEGGSGTNPNALRYNGNGTWTSNEGLIYGQGSREGNYVKHVLQHTHPDPSKPVHTVFNVDRSNIIGLVDEAWTNRGNGVLQSNGNVCYDINMGRTVGTNGETIIRIITRGYSNNIITAFPR